MSFRRHTAPVFALLVLLCAGAASQPPCTNGATYRCTALNIGALAASVNNSGAIDAFNWPNDGTTKRIFGESNLILGAMIDTTVCYSIGYGTTSSNFRPGIIRSDGTPETDRTTWGTRYRVYRIARDWKRMREGAEKEQYRTDYAEWPSDLGAPRAADGTPLFIGDQTTWSVWNDADTSSPSPFIDAHRPLTAEVQQLAWSYERDPILRNVIVVKHTIINKGTKTWKGFYAGNYLYGGVANASTLAGTDSVLELQYVYSKPASTALYGTRTPAFGVVLLQGPVVARTGSIAFDFGRFIENARNLTAAGASTYPQFIPFNDLIYRALQGVEPFSGAMYRNPLTGRYTRFNYTGDPAAGTGWTEMSYPPFSFNVTQRELMMSSGPVDVAPNDTVTIVSAIIAAQGKDRLHSVAILKHFARYLRTSYMSLITPAPPPVPDVSASVLSGRALLTWAPNAERDLVNGFRFQGYNVYQGESASGPWHRIFTADRNDNVAALYEETYQPEFSTLAAGGIQALPNAGLQQHLIITRDSIGRSPLIDGRHHFSVRAVWENAENRPMMFESPDRPVTVVPERIVPGSSIIEPLSRLRHDRLNDDALSIEVIDPLRLTNSTFSVVVRTVNDSLRWDLYRTGVPAPVLQDLRTVAGESTPIVDGFTLRLRKLPAGVRRDNQNPRGWEYLPERNRWMSGASPTLLMDAFSNGLVYPTVNNFYGRGGSRVSGGDLKRVELRFSSVLTQKAYRYVDKVRGFPFHDPPKHPSFEPFIVKRGNGFAYQDYVDVPFTAWEIDSLDGDPVPRQLAVGFVETNDSLTSFNGRYLGSGSVDGRWKPTTAPNGGGELLYLFASPYTAAPQPQYTAVATNLFFTPDSFDILYILSARTDSVLKRTPPYSFEEGDLFRITPNYQLKDGQTYRFSSSPGVVGSPALAKEQKAMEHVTVFPNPYMGGHALESSPSKRFVRLTGLPAPSRIRIYALSGRLVRTFEHLSASSGFSDWDLRNDEGIKVASGLYLIHVDSPGIGTTVLKLMVLYPDERLNAY